MPSASPADTNGGRDGKEAAKGVSSAHPGKGRLRALDVLRGFAASGVMLFHYTVVYDRNAGHGDELILSLNIGDQAVGLFFMISGFVILLTMNRAQSLKKFAIARFSRLFPAFWAATALTTAVVVASGSGTLDPRSLAANMTMLPRLFGVPAIDGVYWTLHVELLFYVFMGCLYLLGGEKHINAVFVALVFIDILGSSLPATRDWWYFERHWLSNYLSLFFVGIILYQMRAGWRTKHFALLAFCILASKVHGSWLTPISTMLLTAVMFAATQWTVPLGGASLLLILGDISYPLYLVHNRIGSIIIDQGYCAGVNANVSIVVAVAVSLVFAFLLHRAVERPAAMWLRGLREARRAGAGADSAA